MRKGSQFTKTTIEPWMQARPWRNRKGLCGNTKHKVETRSRTRSSQWCWRPQDPARRKHVELEVKRLQEYDALPVNAPGLQAVEYGGWMETMPRRWKVDALAEDKGKEQGKGTGNSKNQGESEGKSTRQVKHDVFRLQG